jgi:hypothetical protein
MNPTSEAYPLEGLRVAGAQPLATKFKWESFPLLDQDIIELAADNSYNGYDFAAGPFEYAKKGGREDGQSLRGTIEVGSSYAMGLYCYFPLKIPRHLAYRLGVKSSGYRVERTIGYVNDADVHSFNFFQQEICQKAEADTLNFYDLSPAFVGLEEDPTQTEATTFNWVPEFVESAGNENCNDTTTKTDLQPWRRLLQPEIVQDGNFGLDVIAKIEELFPYPEDATPEETELVDKQRAYAKRFALPLDWEKQKRFFDDAALRQGDIPTWGLVRIPSFELNRTYAVRKDKVRQDALANFGDFTWLGWEEIPGNQRDINLLCRLRWPKMIRVPKWTTTDMGFPEYFKKASIIPPGGGEESISDDIAQNLGGVQYIGGLGGSFSDSYVWAGFFGNDVTPAAARYYAGTEFKNARFWVPYWQPNITAVNRNSGKLPNEYWEESEIPTEITTDFDRIENYGVIAFSAEEAALLGPPTLGIQSIFHFMKDFPGYDPAPRPISWTAQIFKVPDRQTEAGVQSFKYVLGKTHASDTMNGTDITPAMQAFADWATAFFCDPAKYVKIGVYKITDPESPSEPVLSVDLYGHQDLYTSFDVEVILQS